MYEITPFVVMNYFHYEVCAFHDVQMHVAQGCAENPPMKTTPPTERNNGLPDTQHN